MKKWNDEQDVQQIEKLSSVELDELHEMTDAIIGECLNVIESE